MNILRKYKSIQYAAKYCSNSVTTLTLESLPNRSLIRVKGHEVPNFLQGLITNDINHLNTHSNGIYTMFLNKQGRVLYDSIVYKTSEENCYLIECDSSISKDLISHLQLFRVRKKIDLNLVDDELKISTVFNIDLGFSYNEIFPSFADLKNVLVCPDPRLKLLGLRIITPKSVDHDSLTTVIKNIRIESTVNYKTLRYIYGVGEGIDELPPGKCFPLESNCDYMHGVSFHKGCYLGQELTARTYHTGVIRKRLMPFKMLDNIVGAENLEIKNSSNKKIGSVRGFHNRNGLALLRVEQALESESIYLNGTSCLIERPLWWPKEAPTLEKLKNE